MDRTIDDWLTRFAAGAGTLYVWQMHDRGAVYARCGPAQFADDMCPLSAAYTLEHGPVASFKQAGKSAQFFGLTPAQRDPIMQAADWLHMDALRHEIRARLLRICRLDEQPRTPPARAADAGRAE